MSRWVTITTAVAVLLACTPRGPTPAVAKKERGCSRAAVVPTAKTLSRAERAVLCLINRERARHRLSRLRRAAQLTEAAVGHSADMVSRQYFAHESPDGDTARERVLRTGYFHGSAGGAVKEALACGWARLSTPKALMASLMRSRSHKSVLLDGRMREVGVGLVLGAPEPGAGGVTLTLEVARR